MKFNLQKRKASRKDYSLHKSLGVSIPTFPDDFSIPENINDQGALDECTAFASVACRNIQIPNSNFDANAFWTDELNFSGVQNSNGFDIQVPAATAVEKGFLQIGTTNHIAAPSAYFWITPNHGMDLFDSVRQAIMVQNRIAIGGMSFYEEWVNTPGGEITSMGKTLLGGHCIRISGWRTKDGILEVLLPNTWGTLVGDQGFYYMTREVFNQSFNGYGIFQWSDNQNIEIKTLGMLNALWQNLITLIQK